MIAIGLLLAVSGAGQMGTIHFPVTGSAACQRDFTAGMLALHSFVYERAHRLFQQAAQADPACAMARWGDAMAYSHPIWGEEDPKAARAALQGITGEEKLSAKERAFLSAARALWGSGDEPARRAAWLAAAQQMYRAYPGDDEVALEYALALITNSDRLTNTHRLMEAAAISMEVLQRNPEHPGAAHYLIHACDTPDHAILALPAARKYAQIAPAASHALHMPSHIFVQLGMYADVAASNEAAWPASEAERAASGGGPRARNLHPYSWLVDADLNLGELKKAESLMRAARQWLVEDDDAELRFGYALIVSSYLNATGRWAQAGELLAPLARRLPLEKEEPEGSLGCALHAPGGPSATRPPFGLIAGVLHAELRAQAAMHAGDASEVERAYAPLAGLQAAMAPWGSGGLYRTIALREEKLRPALAAGARAVKEKSWGQAAAAFEKLLDLPEVMANGPAFFAPAAQLAGDALLEAGRAQQALAAYEKALQAHPNHAVSLLGAARAAKAAGQTGLARERYAALARLWQQADPDLPAAQEARAAGKLAAARSE